MARLQQVERGQSGVASCACSSASSGAAARVAQRWRAQFVQALQTVAQARQVARPGAAERDSAGDTFDVGKAA
jgi:hypothetical protein